MKPLVLALVLGAGQAQALSCMAPDPATSFQYASEAEERYVLLYGTLTFDEAQQPGYIDNQMDERMPPPVPARFSGQGLSRSGFDVPVTRDITLQPTCAGPWCGGTKSGLTALYFVRLDGDAAVLEAGPCGGNIFENPTEDVLDAMTICMQGGPCEPQTR